ncbi:MarR family winged helix-turn-helix transcriptional regulator [Flavimaricola marinus]|uniref:HTH-type transcriptional repressor NicR n=1 Tax=Flavimaricola marinus TaxID=1819565 RepID=A0A238LB77_9RHOB|nr:MarR family transcriptional regulator [Flavimaricola marinus]SMY06929.1 HTH-type transcriptional repressor NicR [Flavimaricola marinus]
MNADFPIVKMPGHLIRRLHQQSTAVFQERVRAAGIEITSVQFAALSALAQWPGIDQATLAGMVAYDRATIGGVVARLVDRGLVVRWTDADDRRARKLRLTEEGAALLNRLTPLVTELQPQILGSLTEEEAAQLVRLMQKSLSLE